MEGGIDTRIFRTRVTIPTFGNGNCRDITVQEERVPSWDYRIDSDVSAQKRMANMNLVTLHCGQGGLQVIAQTLTSGASLQCLVDGTSHTSPDVGKLLSATGVCIKTNGGDSDNVSIEDGYKVQDAA